MSAFDDKVRGAKARIREVMFSDARLERTIESNADRVAGTKGSTSVKNLSCTARLAPKKITAADGTVSVQMQAKVDVQPVIGDILNYENQRWRVTEIVESAPDGVADQWTVAVQQ